MRTFEKVIEELSNRGYAVSPDGKYNDGDQIHDLRHVIEGLLLPQYEDIFPVDHIATEVIRTIDAHHQSQ